MSISSATARISPSSASASTPQTRLTAHKPLSCVRCVQRKVKCNKRTPCSACVQVRAECVRSTPVPRPRKYKVFEGKEELLARLKRYEELLLNYGVTKEQLEVRDDAVLKPQNMQVLTVRGQPVTEQQPAPPGAATSDNNLWISLSDEILDSSSDDGLTEEIRQEHVADGGSLLFDGSPSDTTLHLEHPQPVQIFELWQIFLENVNPLVKLFHGPTVQQQILAASRNLADVLKSTEALMFSIYALAVTSMTESDCLVLLGEARWSLLLRYHGATQQALTAAKLIRSHDIVVLQAFVLFLLSIRLEYDIHALNILTGVAFRIGQRLGLHREELLAKKSIFEAEMGRRIWWQIMMLETRSTRSAGLAAVSAQTDSSSWDTAPPANVYDSDLSPDMTEPPKVHTGATEMTFCAMRYRTGKFLSASPLLKGSLRFLTRADISLGQKEDVVAELESTLQHEYLQHLDPGIPLHLLSIGAAESVVDRLRLMSQHPRQHPSRTSVSMSAADKSALFALCLRIVRRDNDGHQTPSLRKYIWHIDAQFQSDAFVYLLSELRAHPTGPAADAAWPEILAVFAHRPDMLSSSSSNGSAKPLHLAIANLALKSWQARERAFAESGQAPPESAPPAPMALLRAQRAKGGVRSDEAAAGTAEPWRMATAGAGDAHPSQLLNTPTGSDGNAFDVCMPAAGFDVDDGMQLDAIDWTYWNELMQ